jgi:hypothetical protein
MSLPRVTVVRPITVTPAMLTATDLTEADYPAYNAGTTYASGDRVIVVADHAIYESLQASNTGHTPSTSVDWWIKVSPTNRWKAFDRVNSSRTEKATSMYFEILPGQVINAVGILSLVGATSVRIRVTDPTDGLVYDNTISAARMIREPSWYEWFFGFRVDKPNIVDMALPGYPSATIRIDIYGSASLAVGVILLGQQVTIGHSIAKGASIGITDYSRKEADEYGEFNLVKRAFAKRATYPVNIDNREVDGLIDFFADIRAEPCLWVGGGFDSLSVYGFYKEFEIVISRDMFSDCLLEIEGLT